MTATMDYAARIDRYARAVVGGRATAGKLVRAACRRHLNDLKRAARNDANFPYVFDVAEANRICGLIERFPHIKGTWAKRHETIRLEDWQCFCIGVSHGWLHRETRFRRFHVVYWEVARKNAKTTISAAVALDKIGPDGEQGAEVVAAATKKEQAKIAFSIAQAMVRKAEAFRTEFGIVLKAHEIDCMETESVFKAIDARGSTQDGWNLHFVLADEMHAWKGRELYGALDTAMGSREQAMMWIITTAGLDQAGVCYEMRSYVEKILTGVFADETVFGIIYTIDPGDDPFDEKTWVKANPNFGVSVLPGVLRAEAERARNNAKARGDFLRKRLNVWTNAAIGYFDIEAWQAAGDRKIRDSDFADAECFGALDLASKRDVNAAIRLFPLDNGRIAVKSKFWLPEMAIHTSGNAAYAGWVEERWLTPTPGNVVDYDAIEEEILGWSDLHQIEEWAYDPHQAMQLITHLQAADVSCVEVRPTVLNFSEPMKELDRLILSGKIVHDGNPVMTWMMSNVTAQLDRKDNVYPRKEREENKIDGPVALIAGLNRVLFADMADDGPSVYEQPGFFM